MGISSLDWGMVLGGFGLFMFGIKFMGDGLKATAGDRLRDYIEKYTSNPVSGLFIGIIMTVIMQSSSATSAISIGLVRAGLMTLEQAAGVILGATIGTTVTSFLISVNIEKYAMFIIFAGTMLICFGKKRQYVYIGNVILGFGLIFFGMAGMGDSLAALKELPEFEAVALAMSRNPLLAMLTGVLLTALVQSSAATIGVAQKLYQAGAITFSASLPFMFGANIGTTMTGILASIGGSTEGKRTAALHTTINVISTIIGMVLLVPYSSFIQSIAGNLNPMMQIAVANIIFKVATTLLFLPFVKKLVAFVCRIVPDKASKEHEVLLEELDEDLTKILPSAAVKASENATLKLIDMVRLNLVKTNEFLHKPGTAEDKEVFDSHEAVINTFDQQITEYLINLNMQRNLTGQDKNDVRFMFDAVKNYERVGDLAANLMEFYLMVFEKNEKFSDAAIADIDNMHVKLLDMFDLSAEIFVTRKADSYEQLLILENELDAMEERARRMHFERMTDKICNSPVAESVYSDILGTLERMGDHCLNVGKSAVTGGTSDVSPDEVMA